jgi:LuxR family transcriptional regulator, regulator of acetate metabolism
MDTGLAGRRRDRYGRALEVLVAVRGLLGDSVAVPEGEPDEQAIEQCVDDAVHTLRELLLDSEPTDSFGTLSTLAFRLSEIRQEISTETLARRLAGLTNVQVALARLRAVSTTEEMMSRAPRALCEQCGFTAAALERIADGGRIMPVSAFHKEDPDWEAKFIESLTNEYELHLDGSPLESEMVRRRSAVIVHDAFNDPRTPQEVLRVSGTTSYVAAPIMPEGRVIGFLHATHLSTVDVVDRDILWAFAEGYGYALERTILVERLYQHGEHMRDLLRSTDKLLEQLREADLQIVSATHMDETSRTTRFTPFTAPQSAIHDLLTRREIEIIELMADGETNKKIAARVIVSEGTVKAHVRQILRKLKAANRAEAVSQYTRMLHDRG